ncbi:hypothetical protein KO525_01815 [Psychrosphaera sp. B3R10]|uniref:hypothetical protein n=1 Tax=unclassified Psychrosphaera TaxID=2641570 RepID=UPI001C097196|nr:MULTISPECIES: hypothetical protein [unclassified Psychrosphaera]MBU2883015.1 hypothetical protein [Psychrosphaera sp. I2R16]MBU2988111.1 hypothetical protein [Psychrosphaera sp. B3R10]
MSITSVDAADKSVLIRDESGAAIHQISGMTKLSSMFLFVSQENHKLFYVSKKHVDSVFEENAEILQLKSIMLTGDLPKKPSWEGIVIGFSDNKNYLFLSHEHNGNDGDAQFHQIYRAVLDFDDAKQTLQLGVVKPFSKPLPFLQPQGKTIKESTNFGYEAMLWQGDGQKLLLLPELSSRPAISLNKFGEQQDIEMSQHGFRISDATHIYDQCAIITSFCYKNDPICEKQNKRSKLVLASIQLDSEQIVFNKTVNISEQHLQTNISKNSYPALFNAEGIVMDNGYVYLVNDDNPGNGAFTQLKRLLLPKALKNTCQSQITP